MSGLGNIGKYELRRQISRGAMGLVYEAFDTVIERRVALKMLRTEVFPAEQLPEVRARLKREAHSAGKLGAPDHRCLRRARRRSAGRVRLYHALRRVHRLVESRPLHV